MQFEKIEKKLSDIDIKIDEYQMQYINGMKEVAIIIKDLQEIRAVLARNHQRYR